MPLLVPSLHPSSIPSTLSILESHLMWTIIVLVTVLVVGGEAAEAVVERGEAA